MHPRVGVEWGGWYSGGFIWHIMGGVMRGLGIAHHGLRGMGGVEVSICGI